MFYIITLIRSARIQKQICIFSNISFLIFLILSFILETGNNQLLYGTSEWKRFLYLKFHVSRFFSIFFCSNLGDWKVAICQFRVFKKRVSFLANPQDSMDVAFCTVIGFCRFSSRIATRERASIRSTAHADEGNVLLTPRLNSSHRWTSNCYASSN